MLEIAERRKKFFDEDFQCKIPQEKGKEKLVSSVSLEEIVGSTDRSFINLIKRCFEWNPTKRITPSEALMHEWILKGLPESIR
jgi:dual specificity tyrosine-phosphorylation-regulated kinase 2/3/4